MHLTDLANMTNRFKQTALKNLVYWSEMLAKQLKMKQINKKVDFVACYYVY